MQFKTKTECCTMMEALSFANPCRRNATGDRVSPYLRQMTVGRSVALSVVGLAKSQKRSVSAAAGAAVAAPFAKAASISIWRRREERDDDDGGLACREQIRFLQTELMPRSSEKPPTQSVELD